jgi:hypothetical protein
MNAALREADRFRGRLRLLLLALVVVAAGCSTEGMAFRVDESVDIVSPAARSTVKLPVNITWRDEEPPAAPRVAVGDPAAEYYAAFIDRSPMRPGTSVVDLLDELDLDLDRETCIHKPGCPDPTSLRDLGVVLTDKPEVGLDFLPDLRPTSRGTSKDPHEVTIVRMRGDERVGEAAYRVSFFVRR